MLAAQLSDSPRMADTKWMTTNKRGTLAAAWWNIAICGIVFIAMIVVGIQANAFGFLIALVAVAMEIHFVRILLGIRAERREKTAAE